MIVLAFDSGAHERCLEGDAPEMRGGDSGQAALERPDRGAYGAGDDDFASHGDDPSLRVLALWRARQSRDFRRFGGAARRDSIT